MRKKNPTKMSGYSFDTSKFVIIKSTVQRDTKTGQLKNISKKLSKSSTKLK